MQSDIARLLSPQTRRGRVTRSTADGISVALEGGVQRFPAQPGIQLGDVVIVVDGRLLPTTRQSPRVYQV